ncbi:MAG: ADP-ribosylation factor-like protein [Candidatus Heimdallarchaeota archaeon]
MSLFKRLSKTRDAKGDNNNENKKTVAIVGLDGAGKTTIVNRLLKSEFNHRSLEFVVYDLGGQTPLRETLWEKFVSSADGLVFVLDSTDKERFNLASHEFNNALSYNKTAPVLFLSNKIDLELAASSEEVMKVIDFGALTRIQRSYSFARCSALTGELLFESWDWLTLQLSKELDLPTSNVKILGGYSCLVDGSEIETVILGKPKTQFKHAELFKKGLYEIKKFIRHMEIYTRAETLLQVEDKQLVIVKEKNMVIAIIVGENDPGARAVQIAKKLNNTFTKKRSAAEKIDLKNELVDNYPLDIFKE